ncbi:MAG: hypothetical protein FD147_1861 [Chloroflexi bacterium]|nr:MAG: hypothetical protein FD147_1861 [Chloroflexota bacterium]
MKSLRYFSVNSKLGNLHRRLTELTGSQNEAERRRSRLLATLQVTLILLVSIAFIMTLIFNPAGSEKRIEYCILISWSLSAVCQVDCTACVFRSMAHHCA